MHIEEVNMIGREMEMTLLDKAFHAPTSKLVAMYGRRRVGKTYLLKNFYQNKSALYFDGVENGSTKDQLNNVANQLFNQIPMPQLRAFRPKNWNEFFDTLLSVLPDKKCVLVFDEIQWLAVGQNKLIPIFKSYWDGQFSKKNVLIILCGSIAHFMVKKVIQSKALYGRINHEILLGAFSPYEISLMLKKRGPIERLEYSFLLGGIPKYLEEIDQSTSFDKNIKNLLLTRSSFFFNEADKIFFSQFKEAKVYKKIIYELGQSNLTLEEISKKTHIPSGGGLKAYLDNLEMAQFIRGYRVAGVTKGKLIRYKLIDEFLRFYFQFISSIEKNIGEISPQEIFTEHVRPRLSVWMGFAFEVFCFKHAIKIATQLGFAGKVTTYGPLLIRDGKKNIGQLDLVYWRLDNVITLCEIKFSKRPIDVNVIDEIEKKISKLQVAANLTIEKILITPNGASSKLKASNYFHHILDMEDLMNLK